MTTVSASVPGTTRTSSPIPKSPDSVYILNTAVYRSNDGGKTFTRLRVPHGDNHALWIDPNDPNRLINGNDGGATVSTDRRRDLDQHLQPADRAVLSRHQRQPFPVLHLRRAARQLVRSPSPAQDSMAASIRVTGTTWAEVKAATSPPSPTIRTSCMPVRTAAKSRATITAHISSRR